MYFLIFFPFRVEFLVGTKMLLIRTSIGYFFWGFLGRCSIRVRVNTEWGRVGGGVVGPGQRGMPKPIWDGGEGWEEAVHMPSSVTYVTEKHFFFVKKALACLALGILGGGG